MKTWTVRGFVAAVALSLVLVCTTGRPVPNGPDTSCVVHFGIGEKGFGSGTIIAQRYFESKLDAMTYEAGWYIYVLTAGHCLARDVVLPDGQVLDFSIKVFMGTEDEVLLENGEVVGEDHELDLAIVRFKSPEYLPVVIPRLALDPAVLYDDIYISGSTCGAALTSTYGKVSGHWKQYDIANPGIQPGISGGPVWVLEGDEWRVCGVLVQVFKQGWSPLYHHGIYVKLDNVRNFVKLYVGDL